MAHSHCAFFLLLMVFFGGGFFFIATAICFCRKCGKMGGGDAVAVIDSSTTHMLFQEESQSQSEKIAQCEQALRVHSHCDFFSDCNYDSSYHNKWVVQD